MKLPEHGTIAFKELKKIVPRNSELPPFSFNEAYDITAIFHRLSDQLSMLEKEAEGTTEDLQQLTPDYSRLPEQSDERLTIDVRIRALKKKWNLLQRPVRSGDESFDFPIPVNRLNEFLISKKYAPYINAGAEGRAWLDNWMAKHNRVSLPNEDTAFELTDKALRQLEELMDKLAHADSETEWAATLDLLYIEVDERVMHGVYESWIAEAPPVHSQLGQLKKWIALQEEQALMNQGITETMEGKQINKFVSRVD